MSITYKNDNKPITILFIVFLIHFSILYWVGTNVESLILGISSFALYSPLIFEYHNGRLRFFSPIFIANMALYVMFVARPISTIALGAFDYGFSSFNIEPYYTTMLITSCIGIVSVQVGYFCDIFYRKRKVIRVAEYNELTQKSDLYAVALTMLGLGLFTLFILGGGGLTLLVGLLGGRRTDDVTVFASSSGYLYDGILILVPATLILFSRYLQTGLRYHLFIALISFIPVFIFLSSRGTRSNLLPLVMSLFVYYVIRRNWKPNVIFVSVAIYLSLAIGVNFIRDVRTVSTDGTRDVVGILINSLSSPQNALLDIVQSPDSEMADALAIEMATVPQSLPFQIGSVMKDVYVRAAPKSITGTALESNDLLVQTIWPAWFTEVRASPAFSVLGAFYLDSGFLGLIAGMFVFGSLLKLLYHYYINSTTIQSLLIFSSILPLIIVFLRGTVQDTLARALFIVVPIILYPIIEKISVHRKI